MKKLLIKAALNGLKIKSGVKAGPKERIKIKTGVKAGPAEAG